MEILSTAQVKASVYTQAAELLTEEGGGEVTRNRGPLQASRTQDSEARKALNRGAMWPTLSNPCGCRG